MPKTPVNYPHEKEKKKELGDSEFGKRTSIGRRTSEKPSDSGKFAELQNDEERRKFAKYFGFVNF